MAELLKQIYDILAYNQWANLRLIQNLKQLSEQDYFEKRNIPFNNIHGLVQHLIYYDTKYYHQFFDHTLTEYTENLSRVALEEKLLLYSQYWLNWIENTILTNKGALSSKLAQAIFMLHSHNSYHRGQLNILIGLIGYKAQSLDIFLYETLSKKENA